MADQSMDPAAQTPLSSGMQTGGAGKPQDATSGGIASGAMSSSIQSVKNTTARLAGEARHYADNMTVQAKDKGRSMFEQQKDSAVGQLDSVADALRRTAGQLQDSTSPKVAQYIDMAADQLQTLGSRLREKDLDTLIDDTQNLARRNPGVFLAGTVAAGFLIARFLKSSSQRRQDAMEYSAGMTDAGYAALPALDTAATTSAPGAATGVAGTSTDTAGDMTGDFDTSAYDTPGAAGAAVTPATTPATPVSGSVSPSSPTRSNNGGDFYGNR